MDKRVLSFTNHLLVATILSSAPLLLHGAEHESNPSVWKPRTTSVAVFKNGYGFFQRKAEATLRDGWTLAEAVPPSAFGTVAIYSSDPGEVVDQVGAGDGEKREFNDIDAPNTMEARRAALEERLHLSIVMEWNQGNQSIVSTGRLVSAVGEYAVLENAEGNSAVPIEDIQSISVANLPLRIHVDGSPDDRSNLTLTYLREGITWVPEYTLQIIDDTTAELTLRGTLINEIEDLIDAEVNFVVGVPNFAHKNYDSLLGTAPTLRALSTSFAPAHLQTQIANNILVNGDQTIAEQGQVSGFAETISSLPVLESASASDYTVYRRENLTVRRGERVVVTLFTKRIPYKHQYRWTPGSSILHSLVLDNNTDSAWTTGSCLALSNGNPLSEDLLRYTPSGSKGEFPITAAVNVLGEKTESEIDRKLRDYTPNQREFLDLVRLRGELTLTSFENSEIEMIITAPVKGKPLLASDDGQISTDSNELRLQERRGSVSWSITLKPKEKKILTYEYERYVPSN